LVLIPAVKANFKCEAIGKFSTVHRLYTSVEEFLIRRGFGQLAFFWS